eukprot:TRINITY_DN14132_c0_g1_i1.p1 TRINITY_DN14132_c0_g1~~TRINITY_DN14132_c0_g1_i1.p1  ORF type:complete len:347 (+),score=67.63 TRINITY_DN14132_c0_g1_i1:74-1042(+)
MAKAAMASPRRGILLAQVLGAVWRANGAGHLSYEEIRALVNESDCYDALTNSVHGVSWSGQPAVRGDVWADGEDCAGSGDPMAANPFFCRTGERPGWTCSAYTAKRWCVNGFVPAETAAHRLGSHRNDPRNACCECGGGICRDINNCWWDRSSVVADEGNAVADYNERFYSLDECKAICDNTDGCKSFAYSAKANGHCFLKDKCVTSDEPLSSSASVGDFVTHYKPCSPEPGSRSQEVGAASPPSLPPAVGAAHETAEEPYGGSLQTLRWLRAGGIAAAIAAIAGAGFAAFAWKKRAREAKRSQRSRQLIENDAEETQWPEE